MAEERYAHVKDGKIVGILMWDPDNHPEVRDAVDGDLILEQEALDQEMEVAIPVAPDPESVEIDPALVDQLLTDMESVSTQSAKINALKRFFESLAEGGPDGG